LVATAEAPAKTNRGFITAISKNFETWLKEQGNAEALEKLLALQATYRETVTKPKGYTAYSTDQLMVALDRHQKRHDRLTAQRQKAQSFIDRINVELASR
jgi:hypothetical protein